MANTYPASQTFKFLKSEYSHLRALENSNKTQAIIKVDSIGEEDGCAKLRLRTTAYKQSNKKGLFGWVDDLQVIKDDLEVLLTPDGLLGKVLNISDVQKKWEANKKRIIKKHSKEKYIKGFVAAINELLEDEPRFTASLRYVTPYVLLCSGFSAATEEAQCYREIPNFVGTKTVPIIAKTQPHTPEGKPDTQEIIVTGEIDRENFEQEKVSAFVAMMRDNLRAKTEVQLRYSERYAFKNNTLPTQAMCMSMVVIPGFLYREEESHLKAEQ